MTSADWSVELLFVSQQSLFAIVTRLFSMCIFKWMCPFRLIIVLVHFVNVFLFVVELYS